MNYQHLLLAVFVLLIVVHCLVTLAIAFPWIDTFVNYGLKKYERYFNITYKIFFNVDELF